jgi:hypothetical protein
MGHEVKASQKVLYLFFGYLSLCFAVGAILVEGVVPKILSSLGSVASAGIVLIAILYLKFQNFVAMSRGLVVDIHRYDLAWKKVTNDPIELHELEKLDRMLVVHQGYICRRLKSSSLNLKQRSTNDQMLIILTQAWGVNETFQKICSEWRSENMVGTTGGEGYDERGVLPKRRARAIEKVFRIYGGDATRLRDMVRSSLVFERVAEVTKCLEIILRDKRVTVVEIKNRFASTYDANTESCGYRDVQLKLTLDEALFDPSQLRLGFHEHVCEVQLHLQGIYELKNDEGHRRYVEYRNMMAE